MRDDRLNYVIVGIFVIAMVVGLVIWIAKISGSTGATDAYYIRYNAVPGLAKGAQVFFGGYPIGRIESIEPLDDGDEQRFRLDISVKRDWKIPDNSKAEIIAGFLSAVFINIDGGDSTTYLDPGDRIPSVEATDLIALMTETMSGVGNTIDDLRPQINVVVNDLSDTMRQVKSLLSPENTARVANILVNLERVSEEINGLTDGLGGTRHRIDEVLAQVDRVLGQVADLIEENESELSHSIVDLHESLEAVARHADAIASNLETTTRNMDEFSQQIREDPGVILRGRSAAEEPAGSN